MLFTKKNVYAAAPTASRDSKVVGVGKGHKYNLKTTPKTSYNRFIPCIIGM